MPNTVNEWLTTAKATNPERAAKWRKVFGGDEVPITCPIPIFKADFPRVGEKAYYLLDLRAITADQKERLIASIALDFGRSLSEVRRDIDTVGVPIIADEVIASSRDSGLFFSIIGDDLDEERGLDPWEEDEAWMADYEWGDDSED